MSLVVQKYGGAVLGNRDDIYATARRIIDTYEAGRDVVVVVTAPPEMKNRLTNQVNDIVAGSEDRDYDLVLAAGEQIVVGKLALALVELGYNAVPYLGWQLPIVTDNVHARAFIRSVDPARIRSDITMGRIAVVAGLQGLDAAGAITTLGGEGEDTAAVALASVLQADECEIFTSVDGIYTADPAVCRDAVLIDRLTYEEMLELTRAGTVGIMSQAIEYAMNHNVLLHIRSVNSGKPGTLVAKEENPMDANVVVGIAFDKSEAKIAVMGIPDKPGVAAKFLSALAKDEIPVDMIVQNVSQEGLADLTFSVKKQDLAKAYSATRDIADELQARNVFADERISKVSIVGVGMRSHTGVAARMFSALAYNNINIQMISTSDIKISVAIDEKFTELAVRVLHEEFIPNLQSRPLLAS